jgi:hypothetical protein
MSTKKINELQVTDADGKSILNANGAIKIVSSTTTEIFTGIGVLLGVTIWADVDSGTFHFTNTAGSAITGLPDATDPALTDYPGAFAIPRFEVTAGLKVVTTSADAIVMTVWYFQ